MYMYMYFCGFTVLYMYICQQGLIQCFLLERGNNGSCKAHCYLREWGRAPLGNILNLDSLRLLLPCSCMIVLLLLSKGNIYLLILMS